MKNKIEVGRIYQGDALSVLKLFSNESIDMVLTSPPYWALRDYGVNGQLGLEPTFQEYINKLCDIFDEVKRVLKKDGTCWVNMGDTYMGNSSYSEKGRQGYGNDKIGMINKEKWQDPKYKAAGNSRLRGREHVLGGQIKSKSLCQIPSRFAIEMTNRGWILRNELIWHKPNCMPSSVKDRFTVDFEKLFFFTKNKKYNFKTQYEPYKSEPNHNLRDKSSEKYKGTNQFSKGGRDYYSQGGRNKRCVWSINTKPYKEAHFAVYPEKLIETPIKAGCPEGGVILDTFFGAGTTGLVAEKLNRNYIGIELSPEYIKIAKERLKQKNLKL